MKIQDSALGKYSIQVGINKYIIYDGERSVTTLNDVNEALREIARRVVNDMDVTVTLGEFHGLTESVFEKIKMSYEMIPDSMPAEKLDPNSIPTDEQQAN